MRYLVISDIHSNLAALNAVIADAGSFDRIWCLGDITGYGPDPNECLDRLREFPLITLAGNHDWAVLGRLDLDEFNRDARAACLWTRQRLTAANRDFLESLPVATEEEGYTLVHASPSEPVGEYVLDSLTAEYNFSRFDTPICLVGHSHWPMAFMQPEGSAGLCVQIRVPCFQPFKFNGGKWIINPGSVGQPRDGNPGASYAILNVSEGQWEYRRVAYPVEETQRKMKQSRLPARLIERLTYGH
jgi:diadenosine tetraphosphatase ApaH/serine/threonine PP2A family protein phosphatase